MKSIHRGISWTITAAVAASVLMTSITPASAARARHHVRHQHQWNHKQTPDTSQRDYQRSAWLSQQYGTYPNIRYFERNGHVYNHDLDTGEDHLVKW